MVKTVQTIVHRLKDEETTEDVAKESKRESQTVSVKDVGVKVRHNIIFWLHWNFQISRLPLILFSSSLSSLMLHIKSRAYLFIILRITESQGLEKTSKDLVQSPAGAGTLTLGHTGIHPGEFWMSMEKETLQPFWAARFSVLYPHHEEVCNKCLLCSSNFPLKTEQRKWLDSRGDTEYRWSWLPHFLEEYLFDHQTWKRKMRIISKNHNCCPHDWWFYTLSWEGNSSKLAYGSLAAWCSVVGGRTVWHVFDTDLSHCRYSWLFFFFFLI